MRISDWSSDVCSSDLADQRERLGVAAAVPLQDHQVRTVGRAARDREQRAHAERFHLLLVEDLGLGAVVGGELARLFGDVGRVADVGRQVAQAAGELDRSEEHTSELQSLMRISYAVLCLIKKNRYKT